MILKVSPRKEKRYRLTFDNSTYVDFGQKNGKTYIDGRTDKEKDAWHARHKKDKGYDDPNAGIYYSRMLLWEEPSLKRAIKKFERKNQKNIDIL